MSLKGQLGAWAAVGAGAVLWGAWRSASGCEEHPVRNEHPPCRLEDAGRARVRGEAGREDARLVNGQCMQSLRLRSACPALGRRFAVLCLLLFPLIQALRQGCVASKWEKWRASVVTFKHA